MSSKQTESSQEKKQIPNDWIPASAGRKTKSSKPTSEEIEAAMSEMLGEGIGNDETKRDSPLTGEQENTIGANDTIQPTGRNNTSDSLQTEFASEVRPAVPKRVSSKQRKESLEEYQQVFLTIPKLEDRKPVFISCDVRDRLDEIARKLGGRRMSVSGFIENLARHHLEMYHDDIEVWRKL